MVTSTKFHIAMLPWFAMGHLTAFLQLSNKLARIGHKISFLVPTNTQSKLQQLNLHSDLITFVPLTVPYVQGLPHGVETMYDVPIPLTHLLGNALDLMHHQVEITLQNLKPDLVFFDAANWLPSIGRRLGFKSIYYSVTSASIFAYFLVPSFKIPKDEQLTEYHLMHPPPGYPSTSFQLRFFEAKAILPFFLKFGDYSPSGHQRFSTSIKESDAIAFRTCPEVERLYCDYIESQYMKPMLLSGHVLPDLMGSTLEEPWATWLGGFNERSVVYCSFGSECILEKNQFQELLLGLELSGLPFLVALKPPYGTETVEAALPEGFKDRVKGRGVVHGGWVQQQLILKHPSVGCFVSHCGFGSMWESLLSDCQIVMVPHTMDQFINSKMMSRELKIGVEVERREEDGWFSKEDVIKAVELVMSQDSEVGKEVKSNHAKWKSTLSRDGLHSSYMDDFTHKLEALLNNDQKLNVV